MVREGNRKGAYDNLWESIRHGEKGRGSPWVGDNPCLGRGEKGEVSLTSPPLPIHRGSQPSLHRSPRSVSFSSTQLWEGKRGRDTLRKAVRLILPPSISEGRNLPARCQIPIPSREGLGGKGRGGESGGLGTGSKGDRRMDSGKKMRPLSER